MRSLSSFLTFVTLAATTAPNFQYAFTNPDIRASSLRIPTVHDSAIQARRILNLSAIATISTVFPSLPSTLEQRPDDLGGASIGLMDYYAPCAPRSYDPIILAISIATSFKNARAGSNVTLSLRYHPPTKDYPPTDDLYTYSPANLPRYSLIGHIEALPPTEVESHQVESCFLELHPDARAWTPGNPIHESWWARLVVEEIYWIGGFGDRAYIGWIPASEWRSVTDEEVREARLVGEEGYTTIRKMSSELR